MMDRFELDDVQAQAIVDMRLRTLTGLEREKLEAEYKALMEQIDYLKGILADEKKLLGVIKEEITVSRINMATTAVPASASTSSICPWKDLIPEEDVVITMTNLGYIKRMTTTISRARTVAARVSRACRPSMRITSRI